MARSRTEAYHVAQLEKAAEIARRDLNHMSPGEFLKLREDLFDFCSVSLGPVRQRMTESIPLEKLSEELIREHLSQQRKTIPDDSVGEIVEFLKRMLTTIATKPVGFHQNIKITDGVLRLTIDDKTLPPRLSWDVPPKEAAEFAFAIHFASSGLAPDRIRICPLEKCRNLFVLKAYAREDREHFCSPKCARAAATLRYRANLKIKARKKQRRKR